MTSAHPGHAVVVSHFEDEARSGRWAALYERVDPHTYQFHVRRDRVLELLPPLLGRVIDVGCGTGVMAGPVRARAGAYLGIDASPAMIEQARSELAGVEGVELRVGDAESLPVESGSADQVISMAVIEYLATPDQAISEIARVLAPGGTAVITVPKRIHLERAMLWLTAPARRVLRAITRKRADAVRHAGMQPSELDRRAREAGLVPDGGSHYYFTPVAYPFDRIAPRLAMRLNLPFERWHATRDPWIAVLAQGYAGRYRKP